jgi:hypothetical protein|uniref:Putative site-specific DNA endonuclease n=1 Tax=Oltmannsiellopsis viridis TaxID=51324 RepID=Q20ET1_OLTVI|nr:putative site-specific DNA endonuclease [Oltmannsiellopsis viridis]YP_635914.1 putative site-specific DNA endonuclease [Oltmannsiellopsis viridis]ABB81982.1 putative site-specific DNA endonuclease [Oltmannsiellopsis viridis]ABB82010.1 putative site-specific DNA endonuclease [Oltmannsiellopsis viridis]
MKMKILQKGISKAGQVVSRKGKCETCLNGETPIVTKCLPQDNDFNEDNPVPNRVNRDSMQPRKQPGIYMVRCIVNDWRYYGESNNVSGRLSSHRCDLNRGNHGNRLLQNDFNKYGLENFQFTPLYMGEDNWSDKATRLAKETELIIRDREITYNVFPDQNRSGERNAFFGRFQTEEAKRRIGDAMRGIPNDRLGRKVLIKGTTYPSISEASRQTKMARKTIRARLEDSQNEDFQYLDEAE